MSTAAAAPATVRTEQYILQRLSQANVKKLFGVPGATCSAIFEASYGSSGVTPVVTSSDLGAGYAADGYARCNGLAAVAVPPPPSSVVTKTLPCSSAAVSYIPAASISSIIIA